MITKEATKGLMGVDWLDKEMIHVLSGMEQDAGRSPHVTQNSTPLQTCDLPITEISHSICLNHS